jgi:hypothetical protein
MRDFNEENLQILKVLFYCGYSSVFNSKRTWMSTGIDLGGVCSSTFWKMSKTKKLSPWQVDEGFFMSKSGNEL